MRVFDKGRHLPVMFGLISLFFVYMTVRDLRSGSIWRGGPEPVITRAADPAGFWSMIAFFAVMALVFLGGTLWTLLLLFRDKRRT